MKTNKFIIYNSCVYVTILCSQFICVINAWLNLNPLKCQSTIIYVNKKKISSINY